MATTKVDESGRVLIPKSIRDKLGLRPGTFVEVQRQGDTVLLRPVDHSEFLKLEGGVLVFTGQPTGDMTDVIQRVREERDRHILGMDED